ncbi:hypothetical protein AB6A40_011677 [Gnathostoma spinigerum]|uniref:Uncharacterized protein n=1 Tax=Gnathostoma spinigerum TaxID=75299 RepID=A0ABD6EYB7_9BILA
MNQLLVALNTSGNNSHVICLILPFLVRQVIKGELNLHDLIPTDAAAACFEAYRSASFAYIYLVLTRNFVTETLSINRKIAFLQRIAALLPQNISSVTTSSHIGVKETDPESSSDEDYDLCSTVNEACVPTVSYTT